MPGAVGAGTFWTEMVEWVTGKSTADAAAGHRGQLAGILIRDVNGRVARAVLGHPVRRFYTQPKPGLGSAYPCKRATALGAL